MVSSTRWGTEDKLSSLALFERSYVGDISAQQKVGFNVELKDPIHGDIKVVQ